ncbi:MAG: phage protein Gp27 family protein [Candidatus Competibacter denitrificans]
MDLLPEDIRLEFETRLIKAGFGGYQDLQDWLKTLGYHISIKSLWRHGVKIKRDFRKVQERLSIARSMADQMPDDAENALDKINAITLRDMVFELLGMIKDFDDEEGNVGEQIELINTLSLAQSRLSRAAVNRQKWTEELRARAAAAAEAVEKIAEKSGLSAETAAEIRREILGIAS